jgi:hypothetical protein
MQRLTDPSFVYTPSYETDLKKKFRMIIERERRFQLERKRAEKADAKDTKGASILPIAPRAPH